MPQHVVGLGRLDQLEILDPVTQRTRKLRITGRWIVWDGKRRAFYLTRGRDDVKVQTAVPPHIAKAHRRFHRAAPRGVYRIQVADRPIGATTSLGLVKSLVYSVPKRLKSPGKNTFRWHHAFGDTGHNGGSHYPQRVMPAILKDSRGNIFIKRRPGNIFNVDTWMRG